MTTLKTFGIRAAVGLTLGLFLGPSFSARAEIIELVDKTKMHGKILHYYDGVFSIESGGNTVKLPREKVKSIQFDLPKPRAEFSTAEKTFERWKKSMKDGEMEKVIDRITLANDLPSLSCPLMVAGGGQDHITPGTEAWRIFDAARGEREIVFYPRGGHDCFNVMSELRPRLVAWVARQLEPHRGVTPQRRAWDGGSFDPSWSAAEAVDPDFAEALCGEEPRREWHTADEPGVPVRWEWPWQKRPRDRIEVVHQASPAEHLRTPWIAPA